MPAPGHRELSPLGRALVFVSALMPRKAASEEVTTTRIRTVSAPRTIPFHLFRIRLNAHHALTGSVRIILLDMLAECDTISAAASKKTSFVRRFQSDMTILATSLFQFFNDASCHILRLFAVQDTRQRLLHERTQNGQHIIRGDRMRGLKDRRHRSITLLNTWMDA